MTIHAYTFQLEERKGGIDAVVLLAESEEDAMIRALLLGYDIVIEDFGMFVALKELFND